jgi:hypothetical protein
VYNDTKLNQRNIKECDKRKSHISSELHVIYKGKAIPLQAWTGPESSMRLRVPDFKKIGGKVVSPTHRTPLPLRKYSWYSFLLEAESTSGS